MNIIRFYNQLKSILTFDKGVSVQWPEKVLNYQCFRGNGKKGHKDLSCRLKCLETRLYNKGSESRSGPAFPKPFLSFK